MKRSGVVRCFGVFLFFIWIVEAIGLLNSISDPFCSRSHVFSRASCGCELADTVYILGYRLSDVHYRRIVLLRFPFFFLSVVKRAGWGGIVCVHLRSVVYTVYNWRTCVCYIQVMIYNSTSGVGGEGGGWRSIMRDLNQG